MKDPACWTRDEFFEWLRKRMAQMGPGDSLETVRDWMIRRHTCSLPDYETFASAVAMLAVEWQEAKRHRKDTVALSHLDELIEIAESMMDV